METEPSRRASPAATSSEPTSPSDTNRFMGRVGHMITHTPADLRRALSALADMVEIIQAGKHRNLEDHDDELCQEIRTFLRKLPPDALARIPANDVPEDLDKVPGPLPPPPKA